MQRPLLVLSWQFPPFPIILRFSSVLHTHIALFLQDPLPLALAPVIEGRDYIQREGLLILALDFS